jgi:hypothetical protein
MSPALIIVMVVVARFVLWMVGVFDVVAALLRGPPVAAAAPATSLRADPTPPVRAGVARGLALRSRGGGRGLGELRLEADALVVGAAGAPLRGPRAAIVATRRTRERFGVASDDELLAIEWRTDGGATDELVCQVDDLEGWLAALAPA